jgi:hypothetical protein
VKLAGGCPSSQRSVVGPGGAAVGPLAARAGNIVKVGAPASSAESFSNWRRSIGLLLLL